MVDKFSIFYSLTAFFVLILTNVYIFYFWREVKTKWQDTLPLPLVLIFSLSIISPLFDITALFIFQDYYFGYQTAFGLHLQNLFSGNKFVYRHIYILLYWGLTSYYLDFCKKS